MNHSRTILLSPTKTVHRILADNVVIEEDRRDKHKRFYGISGETFPNRRSTPHDYSQKHKIIYVSIKLREGIDGVKIVGNEYHCFTGKCKVAYADIPFHPDDTLILLEEWIRWATADKKPIGLKRETSFHYLPKQMIIEPASILPLELDSKCQQFTVVKVLGVEEYEKPYMPQCFAPKLWRWKLLTIKVGL